VKLDPNGLVEYATFLGGSGNDVPVGIAVDSTGAVYAGGYTTSIDFPLTSAPLISTTVRFARFARPAFALLPDAPAQYTTI
jgi:Beta-propeller repeat